MLRIKSSMVCVLLKQIIEMLSSTFGHYFCTYKIKVSCMLPQTTTVTTVTTTLVRHVRLAVYICLHVSLHY